MEQIINLNKINRIYFIGIGGIGISATAGIAHIRHFLVEGSDAAESEITADLRSHGIPIHVPHNADNITAKISLVVYSVAVPANNPELLKAQELNITILTYPQFLGLLIKDKYGLSVSGTDGKTTTTAMLAKIMIDAGLDPTVVLGSRAEFLEDNWRVGDSQYFIFEADEYRRAFDNYTPRLAIFTNIGVDHLDYFKDEADYLSAYADYAKRIPSDGYLIINNDNARAVEASRQTKAKIITFATKRQADIKASIKTSNKPAQQDFEIFEYGESVGDFTIDLPGEYNIQNALGAVAAARELNIDWQNIKRSLAEFKGAWRRFEYLGQCGNANVIADYAHTPDALGKVIKAAADFYPNKRILIVFQPHQYARTKNLFRDFVQSFGQASKVLIPDIFYVRGRENPADFDVSSEKLAQAVKDHGVDCEYCGNLDQTEQKIRSLAGDYDIILILGAGDIYEVGKKLTSR